MEIKFDNTKRIGVALSGGMDSMALLNLLRDAGADIVALNVEHGIRGASSVNDSLFVRQYCENEKIEILSTSVDAPRYAREKNISLELAARELRYAFFEEALSSGKVDCIALAHHLDDQAETILMRIFRGTGVRGLRGIVDRKGYIHPLIGIPKSYLEKYVKENRIPFADDLTNSESEYTRNYIRNEIMPCIEHRYPSVLGSFEALSRNAAELEDYLLSEITPAKVESEGKVSLPASVLERHPLIAKKSMLEALRLLGIEKDIGQEHQNNLLALKGSRSNSTINLPFGIDAIKEYDRLTFARRMERKEHESGFDLDSTYSHGSSSYRFERSESKKEPGYFDAGKLPSGLVVRTRRPGDRFRPFGGPSQSLSDYLTNSKIPKSRRDELLVLAKDSKVYIVLGIEISDDLKITSKTVDAFRIIVERC